MSKKEDIKQEEINTAEEIQQVEDNQEVVEEVAEEVPTAEALLLAEAAVELVNLTGRVNNLLLTGVEGMTL